MMDTPPEPLPVQEQRITQSLIDCGLKAEGFTVRYEDDLESILIVIPLPRKQSPNNSSASARRRAMKL